MLRRRKKSPKPDHRAAPASHSRRRARPGASVPDAMKLTRSPGTEAFPPPLGEGSGRVVLVTGFEPFGGESTNPSWEACTRLSKRIAGLRVETLKVPCEFRRAIEVVAIAMQRHRPALVVCVGQAGGRSHMSVERVAINVDDARAPDNGGAQPIDEPIAADGPPAYFATLPIKAMTAAMRRAGVPTEVSNSAGTYVCNHLMYGVLHLIASAGLDARAGFIHVPYAEAQVVDKAGVAAMSIETMARGIEAGIAAAAARRTDIAASEGAFA
jgi:pyroglutamyl-peptidase